MKRTGNSGGAHPAMTVRVGAFEAVRVATAVCNHVSRLASIVAIGGVPGAGKSTVASRLATDLGLPCLASDTLGSAIQASPGVLIPEAVDTYWVGYDLVFRLAEDPILLRCSREQCLERIHRRHTVAPWADPPQPHETDPRILAVFEFLERLPRPEAVTIDAERPAEDVYFQVSQIVATRVGIQRNGCR